MRPSALLRTGFGSAATSHQEAKNEAATLGLDERILGRDGSPRPVARARRSGDA